MIVNKVGFNIYNTNYMRTNSSFKARNVENNSTLISLKDADNLKYDVEYNKLARFKNDVNIAGENINIDFKHGLNGSRVTGKAYNHELNLEYVCKGFNPNKMAIRGDIDGNPVSLRYEIIGNNVNITGDLSAIDKDTLTLMNMLSRDYSEVANNQINLATMIILL